MASRLRQRNIQFIWQLFHKLCLKTRITVFCRVCCLCSFLIRIDWCAWIPLLLRNAIDVWLRGKRHIHIDKWENVFYEYCTSVSFTFFFRMATWLDFNLVRDCVQSSCGYSYCFSLMCSNLTLKSVSVGLYCSPNQAAWAPDWSLGRVAAIPYGCKPLSLPVRDWESWGLILAVLWQVILKCSLPGCLGICKLFIRELQAIAKIWVHVVKTWQIFHIWQVFWNLRMGQPHLYKSLLQLSTNKCSECRRSNSVLFNLRYYDSFMKW